MNHLAEEIPSASSTVCVVGVEDSFGVLRSPPFEDDVQMYEAFNEI